MLIKWCLETGYAGCDIEDELEVEDDATDIEIEKMVTDAVWNYLNLSWRKEDSSETN